MQAVSRSASQEILQITDRLLTDGQNPVHFAKQLVRFLRNAVVAKVAGAGLFPAADFFRRARPRRKNRRIIFGRRPVAASANHAADAFRTRLSPGTALSSRAGVVENVARATIAADGAIAERSHSGAGRGARTQTRTCAGRQKARASGSAAAFHFAVRRRLSAQRHAAFGGFGEYRLTVASGDCRGQHPTSGHGIGCARRGSRTRQPAQARSQTGQPGRRAVRSSERARIRRTRTCWPRCSKPESGRSTAAN